MGVTKKTIKLAVAGKKKHKKPVYTFRKCIRMALHEFSKKRGKDFKYQISAKVMEFLNKSMESLARRLCEDAMRNTHRGRMKTTMEKHMLRAMQAYKM